MTNARDQLPIWAKQMVDAYESLGLSVEVARNRNGSFIYTLNDRTYRKGEAAFNAIERALDSASISV